MSKGVSRFCLNAVVYCGPLGFLLLATAQESVTIDAAVRAAERFIRTGHYDVKRDCPEPLQRQDDAGLFDMQRHCRDYDASESIAYAVSDERGFFRVYFRKSPPEQDGDRESFRVVEVEARPGCPADGCASLKDVELFLPAHARVFE